MVAAPPAEVVGIGLIVSTIADVAAGQGPAPSGSSVVMVSVTVPAVISAAEGVYVVVGSVSSKNPPVPEVVQRIEEADPPNAPAVAWVDPSQMVAAPPAEAVAPGLIVSSIASAVARHGPTPSGSSVVIVKVTEPAVISAAEGV
jgi:hypothetical protein